MTDKVVKENFIKENYKLWKDKEIPFVSTLCSKNKEIKESIEIIKENIYKSVVNEIYDSLIDVIDRHVEVTIQEYKDSCDKQLKIAKDNIVTDEKLKEKIVDLTNELRTLRDGLHESEEARNKLNRQINSNKNDSEDTLRYLIESEDSDKVKVNNLIADLGCKNKYKLNYDPLKIKTDDEWEDYD